MNDAMIDVLKDLVVEQTTNHLQQEEDRLDNMMQKLDNMDEDDLEKMREVRKRRMQKEAAEKHKLRMKGHGEYTEISGDKEFFAALKDCPAAAIHFYRPGNFRCDIMDKHMNILAKKHVEAKFLKINAEKAMYVCEKLHIWVLPSVVLIKGGKTNYTMVGFNDMGCNDEFETNEMAFVLGKHEIIKYAGPDPEESGDYGGVRQRISKREKSSFRQREDSDSDLSD
jgi:hypothetical protein